MKYLFDIKLKNIYYNDIYNLKKSVFKIILF